MKEHYSTVVREEMAIGGSAVNSYERPKISAVSLHMSLKPLRFNPYSVGPRFRTQELTLGSRSMRTSSSLSEPELGIRKGDLVGMRATKHNAAYIYEFRDRMIWNLAGAQSWHFKGWNHHQNVRHALGVRTVIPIHEYHTGFKKDVAVTKVNQAQRDWTFHFSNDLHTELNVVLAMGMALPFEKVISDKARRMMRSKTVRKYMKKVQKQQMKKKLAS